MNIYKRILIKIDIYFLINEQISIKYMESLEKLSNIIKKNLIVNLHTVKNI